MKKKVIMAGAAVIMSAVVVAVGFNANTNSKMTDLMSANLEALTQNEDNEEEPNRCRCGLLWGEGCRMDNWGRLCAPEGTWNCGPYQSNCN